MCNYGLRPVEAAPDYTTDETKIIRKFTAHGYKYVDRARLDEGGVPASPSQWSYRGRFLSVREDQVLEVSFESYLNTEGWCVAT